MEVEKKGKIQLEYCHGHKLLAGQTMVVITFSTELHPASRYRCLECLLCCTFWNFPIPLRRDVAPLHLHPGI